MLQTLRVVLDHAVTGFFRENFDLLDGDLFGPL